MGTIGCPPYRLAQDHCSSQEPARPGGALSGAMNYPQVALLPTAVIVMCPIVESALAPCQWRSPALMWTTSPTLISRCSRSFATLPAVEHEDLRGHWQAGPREHDGGPAFATDSKKTAGPRQELLQARLREDVHRNDELRSDLPQHLDHLLLVQGVGAVDRNHDHVD